jgi:PKD repeat protein
MVLVAAAIGLSACTVKKTEAPPLAGPSEVGLSLRTSIFPDILDQDGISQSAVEVVARGPDGRPMRSVPIRAEIRVDGQIVDFGRLSSRNVVTGDDGIARLTYTSPPAPPEPVDYYTVVTLVLTPIGTDFNGSDPRFVEVRVVPRGVIIPPNGAPIPAFIITPTPVTTYTPVTLDASSTKDEGVICGSACSYAWDFGDGTSGSGMIVVHEFKNAGTYTVRLSVTDRRNQTTVTAQAISVVATEKPKADFVFSPTAPRAGQEVFFNAAASTAAPGHRIVAYDWDFGSGRTGSGLTVAKGYNTPGTYSVTLTVTDDTFQPTGVGVVTKTVTVAVP